MLYPFYCSIQLPIMVLQPCSTIVPLQNSQQDTKKGSHLDSRCFQNFSNRRCWSPYGTYLHQITCSKTWKEISTSCNLSSSQSYYSLSYGFSNNYQHPSSLSSFTDCQKTKIKGYLTNANNRSYRVSPFFFLSILNFHLVWELLTPFLVTFLSILTIKKKMIKFASNNLTQWLLSHCYHHLLPSL